MKQTINKPVGLKKAELSAVMDISSRGPGSGGPPDGSGGGQGNGGGQGGGQGGTKKGDLYGDQYVFLRDLDPTNGGGNGEVVLDANGQPILVGTNGLPIYYVQNADGDYEIPPDQLIYAQTVELERANVARAPSTVMQKSLTAAMEKIDGATTIDTDPAGRILCDGVAIDSPLENLALYQYLMTAGGDRAWPDVTAHWPEALRGLLGADTLHPQWDPSSLLGAAFSKEGTVTMDAVIYENTVLGVNMVGTNGAVDYFDFTAAGTEAYTYDRAARFDGLWLQWYADTDGDPSTLERVQMSVMEAVFGNENWADAYIQVGADPNTFETVAATRSGLNDFAQAADDARAVINFIHGTGAVEIPAPPVPTAMTDTMGLVALADVMSGTEGEDGHEHDGETVSGTQHSDVIDTGGGPQVIEAGNGDDDVSAGGGPDWVDGGNGQDVLRGEGGPDVLMGGNGRDVLIGGPGPDVLTGGNGPDRFVYQDRGDAPAHGQGEDHGDHGDHSLTVEFAVAQEGDSGHGGPRLEIITDFQPAIDTIDLSGLDADLMFVDEPQAYGVWVEPTDEGVVVRVDLDGHVDGGQPAEMMVMLTGVQIHEVSSAAFLL